MDLFKFPKAKIILSDRTKVFHFFLLLDWHDLQENTHLWVQNADIPTFLPTPRASFKIYLTIELPSSEFFLPIANSFLHRSVN